MIADPEPAITIHSTRPDKCYNHVTPLPDTLASESISAMDHYSHLVLTRFALLVDQAMKAIPLTGPPFPDMSLDVWDGQIIDIEELGEAYQTLPAAMRDALKPAYEQCLDVLRRQNQVASGVYSARVRLLADIMTHSGLSPEQLIPDLREDGRLHLVSDQGLVLEESPAPPAVAAQQSDAARPDGEDGDGDDNLATVLPFLAPVGDPSDASLHARSRARSLRSWLGPASLAAAVCLGTFTWHYHTTASTPTAPATAAPAAERARTLSVEISSHDGPDSDVHAAVSLDERTGDTITQVRLPARDRTSDTHRDQAVGDQAVGDQAVGGQAVGDQAAVVNVRTTRRGSHTTVTIDSYEVRRPNMVSW